MNTQKMWKKASHRWTRKPLPTWCFEIAFVCKFSEKRPTELPIDAEDIRTHTSTFAAGEERRGHDIKNDGLFIELNSCNNKTKKKEKKLIFFCFQNVRCTYPAYIDVHRSHSKVQKYRRIYFKCVACGRLHAYNFNIIIYNPLVVNSNWVFNRYGSEQLIFLYTECTKERWSAYQWKRREE